jgi:predicted dehydrogenase
MKSSPLKVVCIGGWGHASMVFDEMIGMAEAELRGFAPADRGEDLSVLQELEIFAQRGVRAFDDHLAMLEEIKPHVAIVSTRLDQVAPVATSAANAGCHLICEKPLGVSHEQFHTLRAAVAHNKVRLMAMHSMRNFPAFIAARKAFQEGLIGEAIQINARKSYRWGNRPEWFAQRDLYGGIIPWIGIHALDVIHFVTGKRFTKVFAMHGNHAHADYAECEDHAVIVGSLDKGGHASISIDMLRPEAAALPGDDWIRVLGMKGMLEANASKGVCEIVSEGGAPTSPPLPESGAMFRSFLLSLRGQGSPSLSTDDSFLLTHACLVARDSADGEVPMTLREFDMHP